MEKVKDLLNVLKKYGNYSLYSAKTNVKNKKIYKYDQEVNKKLVLDRKLEVLEQLSECPIYEYDVYSIDKDIIQQISVDKINWFDIQKSINELDPQNLNEINPTIINRLTDMDILLLDLEDGRQAYIINKHITIGSAFRNKTMFSKKTLLAEDNIYAFNDYPDVVILDNNCYIFNENKFNSMFNFREKIDKKVEGSKEIITSWQFIQDGEMFYQYCLKNYNTKRAIIKVLDKDGVDLLTTSSPSTIKKKLLSHDELVDKLTFDPNTSKLLVNDEICDLILKILTNKIGQDLFTDKLFGMGDGDEVN